LHSDRRYRAAFISLRWEKLCIFKQASGSRRRQVKRGVGVPILFRYSSKRLLYTAIGGTCKNTIGGTQWENF